VWREGFVLTPRHDDLKLIIFRRLPVCSDRIRKYAGGLSAERAKASMDRTEPKPGDRASSLTIASGAHQGYYALDEESITATSGKTKENVTSLKNKNCQPQKLMKKSLDLSQAVWRNHAAVFAAIE